MFTGEVTTVCANNTKQVSQEEFEHVVSQTNRETPSLSSSEEDSGTDTSFDESLGSEIEESVESIENNQR